MSNKTQAFDMICINRKRKLKIKILIAICSVGIVLMLLANIIWAKKSVGANFGYVLYDTETYPEVAAPYETESKAVLAEYLAVADKHVIIDENSVYTDYENKYVQAAAKKAASQLYAYACYNEEYLDRYVYFSNQQGTTDLGSMGSTTATKQDYKLIIHESETVCGYKYHYTIKNVDQSSGIISAFESQFESCRLRFVEAETNCLYRFEGDNVTYDSDGYLTCNWNIDTTQSGGWGSSEGEGAIVKRSGGKLTIDEIEQDIVTVAEENPSNAIIHGNINIFADNIFSDARIIPYEDNGNTLYIVSTKINTSAINADSSSLAMVRQANSSSDCKWTGDNFTLSFVLWDNGLFYYYRIVETWGGTISGFTGNVSSTTTVTYSYSSSDTDITQKVEMLEKAKEIY